MRKGELQESRDSFILHGSGVPTLISPLFLRSRDLGQIDNACLKKKHGKWVLKLVESKTSVYPSAFQLWRLRRAQEYLSILLDMPVKLEVNFCQKADPSLFF